MKLARWSSLLTAVAAVGWIGFEMVRINRPVPIPEDPAFHDDHLIIPRANFNPSLAVGYEEQNRDIWQKPQQVLETLEPLEGLVVADIGCGEGYFTLSLLDLVGPEGKVIATDIREDMLLALEDKVPAEMQDRIELVLSDGTSLGFDQEVDLVLVIQVLGEVEQQVDFMQSIKQVMHGDSRLVLIDTRYVTDRDSGFTRPLNLTRLKERLKQLGFVPDPQHESAELNFLSRQFFLVLKRATP